MTAHKSNQAQTSRKAAIFTAIPVEYKAVKAHLTNPQEVTYNQSIYEIGEFTGLNCTWQVLIYEVGPGGLGIASAFERVATYFNPEIAFFVGIAGGIKDVDMGDVVVTTKVYNYEPGRVEESQFLTRPEVGNASFGLLERAKFEARSDEWLKRLPDGKPAKEPQVLLGAIAAGEKLITSPDSALFKLIQTNFNDTLAVDMEGHGFFKAAHPNAPIRVLIIRGISDLVYNKAELQKDSKEKETQKVAAQHASAFAFQVLAKL